MMESKCQCQNKSQNEENRNLPLKKKIPWWMHLVAWIMHRANSIPIQSLKYDFYAVKDRILSKYGTHDGFDYQEFVRPCWNCEVLNSPDPKCYKCRGAGNYSRTVVQLQRYRLGRYLFHIPRGLPWNFDEVEVTIHGYVKHPYYGALGMECMILFMLIYSRESLAYVRSHHLYGWKYPLTFLLWAKRKHQERVGLFARCYECGRIMFRNRLHGICQSCMEADEPCDDDVPF